MTSRSTPLRTRVPTPKLTRGTHLALDGERWRLGALAATAFVGGSLEACFLVLATQAAFALTEGDGSVEIAGSIRLSVGQVVATGLVIIALRLGFAAWGAQQAASLVAGVVARMRRLLASGFLRAEWSHQQDSRGGQLQELLTTFALRGAELVNALSSGIVASFSLLALVGIAIAVDPIGALAVLIAAIALGSLLRPLRTSVRGSAKAAATTGMNFASSLAELSQLGLEINVKAVQDEVQGRVGTLVGYSEQADRRVAFMRALVNPVYTTLAYLALIGGIGVISLTSESNLAAIGTVMLLMLRSLSYGQGIQTALSTLSATTPYADAVADQLEAYRTHRRHEGDKRVPEISQLNVDGLEFTYEDGTIVFRGIDLRIGPSEIIGLVGRSGGGKSTLVELLLGLRSPTAGSVSADGTEIRSIHPADWAQRVSLVPQVPMAFDATIAENIRFFRPEVTDEEILDAVRRSHLSSDIARFPEGLERRVGVGGDRLSGGQRQRVCIARALVGRPDILILDEPTSALDKRSEIGIRETLLDLGRSMTIVIVAHRPATLEICDRIIRVEEGRLTELDGTRPADLEK